MSLLFTLYSIEHNKVIGYRFSQLIQVANNALQHYTCHFDIILKAIKVYDRYESLMGKQSFRKKIREYSYCRQNLKYDNVIIELFPNLIENLVN